MHTVLVHPKNMSGRFENLTLLEEYLEGEDKDYPVIRKEGDKRIWCPQSTSSFHPHGEEIGDLYKAWDHLTFAFVIPGDTDGISIPDEDLLQWIGKVTFHDIARVILTPDKGNDKKAVAMTKLKYSVKDRPGEKWKKLRERISICEELEEEKKRWEELRNKPKRMLFQGTD